MGEFNAKIGSDYSDCERITERHGLGEMTKNEHLFAEFYQVRA